jgi:hypothetical protein
MDKEMDKSMDKSMDKETQRSTLSDFAMTKLRDILDGYLMDCITEISPTIPKDIINKMACRLSDAMRDDIAYLFEEHKEEMYNRKD